MRFNSFESFAHYNFSTPIRREKLKSLRLHPNKLSENTHQWLKCYNVSSKSPLKANFISEFNPTSLHYYKLFYNNFFPVNSNVIKFLDRFAIFVLFGYTTTFIIFSLWICPVSLAYGWENFRRNVEGRNLPLGREGINNVRQLTVVVERFFIELWT